MNEAEACRANGWQVGQLLAMTLGELTAYYRILPEFACELVAIQNAGYQPVMASDFSKEPILADPIGQSVLTPITKLPWDKA